MRPRIRLYEMPLNGRLSIVDPPLHLHLTALGSLLYHQPTDSPIYFLCATSE